MYAQLGDTDTALALLDEAIENREGDISFLNGEFLWDPLRGDPRFEELLRRLNFPNP